MDFLEFVSKIIRDLCCFVVGSLGFIGVPPSIEHLGFNAGPITHIWAGCLAIGGFLCFVSVIRRWPMVEINACALVGVGFFIWFVAAVARPETTVTMWQLALVYLAGTAGQIIRIVWVAKEEAKRRVIEGA